MQRGLEWFSIGGVGLPLLGAIPDKRHALGRALSLQGRHLHQAVSVRIHWITSLPGEPEIGETQLTRLHWPPRPPKPPHSVRSLLFKIRL